MTIKKQLEIKKVSFELLKTKEGKNSKSHKDMKEDTNIWCPLILMFITFPEYSHKLFL